MYVTDGFLLCSTFCISCALNLSPVPKKKKKDSKRGMLSSFGTHLMDKEHPPRFQLGTIKIESNRHVTFLLVMLYCWS